MQSLAVVVAVGMPGRTSDACPLCLDTPVRRAPASPSPHQALDPPAAQAIAARRQRPTDPRAPPYETSDYGDFSEPRSEEVLSPRDQVRAFVASREKLVGNA